MSSWSRFRSALSGADDGVAGRLAHLEEEVATLRVAVAESQRLNERLSDVLDVVCELLVPAVDRDDERLRQALADATQVVELSGSPRTP